MAGMGPPPKAAGERRRRNRVAGARILELTGAPSDVPPLPERRVTVDGEPVVTPWNPQTVAWWADVWSSPMSAEYHGSDLHGLLLLAVLVDDFWRAPTKELAAEIRLQRQCFGLSPIDRRRLQWEIAKSDEATERRAATKRPAAVTDPRVADAGTSRRTKGSRASA